MMIEKVENYTNNEELKNVIYEFIKMRKTIKKPLTDYALTLFLKKLDKFDNKIDVLNQSILNCWQGIYDVKKDVLPDWFDKDFEKDERNLDELDKMLSDFK